MARAAAVPSGSTIRWSELPGDGPARVFLHGLGSASVAHFLEIASDPRIPPRRTLLVDLLGYGLSDRPAEFDYSLDGHAAAVAAALDHAGVAGVSLIGHSLGGSISIVLARHRPDLVADLVAIEPNLVPWDGTDSVEIARQSEAAFVETGYAAFVETGYAAFVAEAGPEWAATIRLADPVAIHRSSRGLCEGSVPVMRDALLQLAMPRTLVWGALTRPPPSLDELVAAGIGYIEVPLSGHVPMEDNPEGLVDALASVLG